jgi:hypothetical protein
VRDIAENKLLFSRTGADVDGLHIKSLEFAGNYIYIDIDSDSPVIDITNSQKVSSSWKVRPTDLVNRDWVPLMSGHVTDKSGSCFQGRDGGYTCGDAGNLVHAPNGNYPGPWY